MICSRHSSDSGTAESHARTSVNLNLGSVDSFSEVIFELLAIQCDAEPGFKLVAAEGAYLRRRAGAAHPVARNNTGAVRTRRSLRPSRLSLDSDTPGNRLSCR